MRAILLVGAIVAAAMLWACQGDPGRDVKPMADPMRRGSGGTVAPAEVMPIEKVSKSQPAAVSQRIANTEITITYSRPVARGRDLFGKLVPFEQVWNPGADRATAVTLTRDVQVTGQTLAAGNYSLWAIPRPAKWTMIFSRAADVYHTPYPGETQDALRIDVPTERGPHMEVLTFSFPMVEGKDAVLRLHWGEVMVPLSIRVP
jgi:hypothetical protein